MITDTDIVLMRQVKKGDEAALRELIDRYRERLFRMAYGLLCDRDAAADAVQETFIRLWTCVRRYDPRYTVAAWLYTICARRCYDELRHRRRHREMLSEMPDIQVEADTMEAGEMLDLLHRAVAALPIKQRIVYQLREVEDLSTEETAKATRMTVDQVKANLWNARNTVRKKLNRYGI